MQKLKKLTAKRLFEVVQTKAFWMLAVFLLLSPNLVHAQSVLNSATGGSISAVTFTMGWIITGLNFLMWILFWILNIVSDPEFIFNPGVVTMLRGLWVFSRDIVNILFAMLLIVGSILWTVAPIVYSEKLKGLIPKFVMAVILVNFSWFIPRVIYDASSVLTYSIYQVPTLFTGTDCRIPTTTGATEPCKYVNDIAFLDETDRIVDGQNGWECWARPLFCIQTRTLNGTFQAQNRQSITFNGLIVNYARLRHLVNLVNERPSNPNAPLDIGPLIKILMKYIVILVIHIALFFPLLAMVAAFFIRIPVLWITMAFMPFYVLSFVAGEAMGSFREYVDKIGSTFLKAAFLPALVGIPFAVGFILLNAGMTIPAPTTGSLAARIPIFVGLGTFWQLFWLMMALGVLWVGVFAVLKGDDIMGHFTESIKGQGQALGSFVAKTPLSVPFIGLPGSAEKQSLSGMWKNYNPKALESKRAQRGNIYDIFGGGGTPAEETAKRIDENIFIKVENKTEFKEVLNGNKKDADAKAATQAMILEIRESPEIKNDSRSRTNLEIIEGIIEKRRAAGKPLTPAEADNLRKSLP